MTKKLNITSITNELEGSAFFPSKKTTSVPPTPQPVRGEPKPPEVIRSLVKTLKGAKTKGASSV
jgi:hypothetical protein